MILTQKETTFLQDLKSQEELCVEKYEKYSAAACDGTLKSLFQELGQTEQQHLDSVTKILGGTIPQMGSGKSQSSSASMAPELGATCSPENKEHDKYLCSDALATEKHVSSVYNTSIFEFKDCKLRDVLNHIQKEEQEHGEKIYNYMAQNGMYNA